MRVFVVQYLLNLHIIKEEEADHLNSMITSSDPEMKGLAQLILLERWKQAYPTSKAGTSSMLFQYDKK